MVWRRPEKTSIPRLPAAIETVCSRSSWIAIRANIWRLTLTGLHGSLRCVKFCKNGGGLGDSSVSIGPMVGARTEPSEAAIMSYMHQPLAVLCLTLASSLPVAAQSPGWTQPFPGHRVIGNLYAVGTYDLGVFLVTSDKGHFLINTGLEDSTPLIRRNIESLGFGLEDVKVLLTMQAHWDHTAALAEIKKITGAEMWATVGDAPVLEDGGFSDAHFGGKVSFKPVKVDRVIKDGEVIELGDAKLTVMETRGHTAGSVSYAMKVSEGGRDYDAVIANMASINAGKRLVVNPTYPGVAEDFAETFRKQKALPVDVWVAAHGSQYGLHKKHKAGQAYSAEAFVDPEGYRAAVRSYEKLYLEQLAAERR